MKFKRQSLSENGFQGFVTFGDLRRGKIRDVPAGGGVYVVLREIDVIPKFLEENPGGRFKSRNPTVDKSELFEKWVEGAHVIYIGKGDELQRRMKQFIEFGTGKPIGHWGGRLVWQVENSGEFVVAWKRIPIGQDVASFETQLLNEFVSSYGKLPFANLRH